MIDIYFFLGLAVPVIIGMMIFKDWQIGRYIMIVKFQLHFIIAAILFGLSSLAFSADELHVVPSTGKLGYPVGDYNANGIRTWRTLDGSFVKEYSANHDRNLFIRDLERKVRSANTVPAVIKQTS